MAAERDIMAAVVFISMIIIIDNIGVPGQYSLSPILWNPSDDVGSLEWALAALLATYGDVTWISVKERHYCGIDDKWDTFRSAPRFL